MADGRQKQALSLNQLHNRFLVDLSASQSRPKTKPVDNTESKLKLHAIYDSSEGNDDCPRFDFDSPSPSLQEGREEPLSKTMGSSPHLFAGIADFDSPSSTLDMREESKRANGDARASGEFWEIEEESCKISEENDNASKKASNFPGISDVKSNFPGDERLEKVRIEGRRRLCKVSKNNDIGTGKSSIRAEEPTFDGIADFDSPLLPNKACGSNENEIGDILNNLSSRLGILSIEKKMLPRNKGFAEDFQESTRSKIYDVNIKEGSPKKWNADFPSLRASETQPTWIKRPDMGVSITNEHPKQKHFDAEIEDDTRKANRTIHHGQARSKNVNMRPSVKEESAKESHAYRFLTEVQDIDAEYNKKHIVKQVDRRPEKITEVSDDETDGVSLLDDQRDDFTLSGPKGTYRLPGKIAKKLYPHQREGLNWLWSLHCKGKGGILGDDMGLGKTMQMCGYLAGLFHSNLIKRALIVAPKTLLTHWINELSAVGLSNLTREYFSSCAKLRHYELQYVLQDKGILLTTYDIVRNNVKSLIGDYPYNYDGEEDDAKWDYMILDEGHLIKNPSTQRAKSLLQIPCCHRIIISGTPLQNNLKELWALFNFCCPELLGDKKEFKDKYEHFINRGNEKNASDREKRIGSSVAKKLARLHSTIFSETFEK